MLLLKGAGIGSGTIGSEVVTTTANGESPVIPTIKIVNAKMACRTAAAIFILNSESNASFAQHTMGLVLGFGFFAAVLSNDILVVLLDSIIIV